MSTWPVALPRAKAIEASTKPPTSTITLQSR